LKLLEQELNIKEEIKKIFFEVFGNINNDNFDWQMKQEDYINWDSFALLELITSTESKFNIKISPEDAISIQSAENLLNTVKSKI
jgi:acyl carrier protein